MGHVAGDALPQVDGEGFDFLLFFAGGGFENQFFGTLVQQQDRTGFGVEDANGGFQNQFEKFFQVLGGGHPTGDFMQPGDQAIRCSSAFRHYGINP